MYRDVFVAHYILNERVRIFVASKAFYLMEEVHAMIGSAPEFCPDPRNHVQWHRTGTILLYCRGSESCSGGQEVRSMLAQPQCCALTSAYVRLIAAACSLCKGSLQPPPMKGCCRCIDDLTFIKICYSPCPNIRVRLHAFNSCSHTKRGK